MFMPTDKNRHIRFGEDSCIMEKRFRRVQRWLERCIEACRKEKWSNAVADVECARAELEAAREELWSAVSEARSAKETGYLQRALPLSVRSAILAVAVIMAAALPLSTGTVPAAMEQAENRVILEWVTSDEKSLLTALRQNLSEMNSARNAGLESANPVSNREEDRQVARVAAPLRTQRGGVTGQAAPAGAPPGKAEVSIDEILSLYEIGQRALRSDSVVFEQTIR
jgi:hypothetical protein